MGTLQLLLPGLVGLITHVWNSTWACCRPPGPVACPAPAGPVPAWRSEQRCSGQSPPQKCERQPTWLHKSGSYHLYNWTLWGCFWVDNINVNIKDDLDGWILSQCDSWWWLVCGTEAYVLMQCEWTLEFQPNLIMIARNYDYQSELDMHQNTGTRETQDRTD